MDSTARVAWTRRLGICVQAEGICGVESEGGDGGREDGEIFEVAGDKHGADVNMTAPEARDEDDAKLDGHLA